MKRALLPVTLLAAFAMLLLGFHAGGKKNRASLSSSKFTKPAVTTGKQGETFLFFINNLAMPLDNSGIIANAAVDTINSGEFDGIEFLFSGGFLLSGKVRDTVWANGVASSSRIEDYLPGRIMAQPSDDPQIYVVDANDPPFGACWQDWSDAVKLGADFYDGDNDGIYSPIDKNNNGQWDQDEDRPDLLGDQTAWCVYNDSKPTADRYMLQSAPQGLEIHQTMFGFQPAGPLANTLFLRYRIINRGTKDAMIDSVYFSVWADADLGEYTDDLVGSDTSRRGGFTWNDGSDDKYGNNPPCFFIDLLQGPAVYLPGVTFTDVDGNGVYDSGTDVPLDTAYNVQGPVKGVRIMPGARNQPLSSFTQYASSDPYRGDPRSIAEARNYMRGGLKNGQELDPCRDPFGSVFGVPCSNISRRFWYSGNVIPNLGWIFTNPTDVMQMQNVGPFTLVKDQPVDIFAAYIVGRGTNARTSVGEAQRISDFVQRFFDSNFDFTVGVRDLTLEIPHELALRQNYPNPFKPSTKINFTLPVETHVRLQVFDILGREVEVLVHGRLGPGLHEVEFAPKVLPSGVYFYKLQAGEQAMIRKMILF